jgi:hypothetical protein
LHPEIDGVIVYMITALDEVALTGVSVMAPKPLGLTPDKVPITEDVQLNVAPLMEEVGKKFKLVALHIS